MQVSYTIELTFVAELIVHRFTTVTQTQFRLKQEDGLGHHEQLESNREYDNFNVSPPMYMMSSEESQRTRGRSSRTNEALRTQNAEIAGPGYASPESDAKQAFRTRRPLPALCPRVFPHLRPTWKLHGRSERRHAYVNSVRPTEQATRSVQGMMADESVEYIHLAWRRTGSSIVAVLRKRRSSKKAWRGMALEVINPGDNIRMDPSYEMPC